MLSIQNIYSRYLFLTIPVYRLNLHISSRPSFSLQFIIHCLDDLIRHTSSCCCDVCCANIAVSPRQRCCGAALSAVVDCNRACISVDQRMLWHVLGIFFLLWNFQVQAKRGLERRHHFLDAWLLESFHMSTRSALRLEQNFLGVLKVHAANLIKVADKTWVDTMRLLALLDPQPDFLHIRVVKVQMTTWLC